MHFREFQILARKKQNWGLRIKFIQKEKSSQVLVKKSKFQFSQIVLQIDHYSNTLCIFLQFTHSGDYLCVHINKMQIFNIT